MWDAITAGKIDHWVIGPVQSPDEDFHQSITQFLGEWRSERGGGFEAVQVIGEQWSPRSQELRDTFSRNGIPIGFYDAGSARGRQMLAGLGLESAELPVVVLRFDGQQSALANPSNLEIADAFGLMTPIPTARYSTSRWWERARRDWPPPSTPPPRACAPCSSSARPSAARREPAR
jgi:hypothetical protein